MPGDYQDYTPSPSGIEEAPARVPSQLRCRSCFLRRRSRAAPSPQQGDVLGGTVLMPKVPPSVEGDRSGHH